MEEVFRLLEQRVSNLEVKEPQPVTIAVADASSSLTLAAGIADVAGATLTLTAGVYTILGLFDVQTSNDDLDNNQTAIGTLSVGGVAQTSVVTTTLVRIAATTRLRTTMLGIWTINVPFDTPTIVKLRANKSGGTGTSQVLITNTRIMAIRGATYGL